MKDDWLSKLALTYLGDANRWPEIYDANQSVIEAAARAHGYASSDHGHWIFPGTTLSIPGTACPPSAGHPQAELTPTDITYVRQVQEGLAKLAEIVPPLSGREQGVIMNGLLCLQDILVRRTPPAFSLACKSYAVGVGLLGIFPPTAE